VYPSTLSYGQSATLSWTTSYVSSGSITYVGNVSTQGSTTVTPTQSMTYTGNFTGQNGLPVNCSATVSVAGYPVAYNYTSPNPTVTLSAVPYTGLDLGTFGTVAYWSFLALWFVLAAYLVAVKRIQNGIARRVTVFLFGTSHTRSVPETGQETDSFIESQLTRFN
jgi:hypothetical protein